MSKISYTDLELVNGAWSDLVNTNISVDVDVGYTGEIHIYNTFYDVEYFPVSFHTSDDVTAYI